jgi:molecular chaperone GrpE
MSEEQVKKDFENSEKGERGGDQEPEKGGQQGAYNSPEQDALGQATLEKSEADQDLAFKKVQEDLGQAKDRYMRLLAEFENFKKRSEREQKTALQFANERLMKELLPVLDHLDQALFVAEGVGEQDGHPLFKVVEGVGMVSKQFKDTLARFGLKSFSALGQPFDPQTQEALGEREADDVGAGTVVEEYQKGYMLHERLVRPARVIVAKRA